MNHEEEIRLIAYQIWEDEGCQEGFHLEHWIRAESTWQEQHGQATIPASSKPAAPRASGKKKRARTHPRHSKR